MTDQIRVNGINSDNAVLLLAAAEKLGVHAREVRTSPLDNVFIVPADVAKEAGFDDEGNPKRTRKAAESKPAEDKDAKPAKSKPARKRAPRKQAAKKAAPAKKAEAKPDEGKGDAKPEED